MRHRAPSPRQGREEPAPGTGHGGSLPIPAPAAPARSNSNASLGVLGVSLLHPFRERFWEELGVGGRCVSPV